jgi:2-C-methyl-D-erythritol 4-phosphate cytidylyltransferase
VIIGGATRQESVRKGIEHLSESSQSPDFVIIHDAARPFLTNEMIGATIKSVTEHGACTLGIPLTDTIKRVSDGVICETLDRSSLYLIQTPQAGRFDWLLAAHRKAAREKFQTTDDAAILEFGGHAVSIVPGSKYNLKITNPEDMAISEALAPIILETSG